MTTKQLSIKVSLSDAASAGVRAVAAQVVSLGRRAMAVTKGLMAPIAGLMKSLLSLKTLLTGAFVAIAGGAAFQSIRRAAEEMDELVKTSRQLGLSAQFLSELKYAADLSGVSFEGLSSAAAKAARNIHEALESGKGMAADAFRELGVSLRDADGAARPFQSVLLDLSDAFNRLDSSYEKVAYSQAIFGKGGTEMLRLLDLGRPAIAAMAEEARRLGVVFTDEQLENAEQFNDAISRIGKAWLGLRAQVIGSIGDDMADILNKIASAVAAIPKILDTTMENVRLAFDPNSEAGAKVRAAAAELMLAVSNTLSEGVLGAGRVVIAASLNVLEGLWNAIGSAVMSGAHILVQTVINTTVATLLGGASILASAGIEMARIALVAVSDFVVGNVVELIASAADAAIRTAQKATQGLTLAIPNLVVRSNINAEIDGLSQGVRAAVAVIKADYGALGDVNNILARSATDVAIATDTQRRSWESLRIATDAANQASRVMIQNHYGVADGVDAIVQSIAEAENRSNRLHTAWEMMTGETGYWANRTLQLADGLTGTSAAMKTTAVDIESITEALRGVKPALEEIEAAADSSFESLNEGPRGFREGWISSMKAIEEQSKNTFALASDLAKSLTVDLSSGLASAFVDGISNAKNFGDAVVDVLRDVAKAVAKAIAQFLILKAIMGIAGSFGGGGDKVIGSVGGAGSTAMPSFGGAAFANKGLRSARSNLSLTGAAIAAITSAGVPAYAMGTSSVPGPHTNRDVTLAMLTPREAVLTPRAADTLGRDRIDHLNRGGSMGGGGMVFAPTIHVNVQASPGTDGNQVGRDIGRNIAAELLKELARNPAARAQFRGQLG